MRSAGGLRPVRVWWCTALLLGMAWQPFGLRAADPPAKTVEPADEDLIEFLGSVDSDDEDWKRYLARTGMQTPVAGKPQQAPPSSSAPGKDDAKVEH